MRAKMNEIKARKYPLNRDVVPIVPIVIIAALLLVYIFVLVTVPHNDGEILSVIIREDTSSATILYDNGKYETIHVKHSDDAYHVKKMCVVTTLWNYGDKSITVEKSKITYIGIQPQG